MPHSCGSCIVIQKKFMKTKFNAYNKTIYDFITDIYIVCPNCEKQAIVKSKGFLKEKDKKEICLICPECGMNKYFSDMPPNTLTSDKNPISSKTRSLILSTNIDPYFRLPLWLQAELPDGLLWAYNYEHLDFLENHVSAELRFRDTNHNNHHSLGVRLPKWMTSKKNRTQVLKAIEKLKIK